jgi:diguanylate cyclase (GGDEF)-like protein
VLEKQFGLAARKGDSLALLFCDLDGLKRVNDELGHAEGDKYIKIACSILARSIRDSDTLGRLGGDEFLVILPDCDREGAAIIDGRVEAAVAEANAEAGAGVGRRHFPISISRGLALSGELKAAGAETTPKALVDLADERMYEDKRHRRL